MDCPSGLFETNSASEIKGVLNVDELLAFEVIGSEINNQIYKDSKEKYRMWQEVILIVLMQLDPDILG